MALRRLLSAVAIVALISAIFAAPVSAHTGFESSSPGDGDIIDEPVSEITLTFSGAAAPTGEGFVILDPEGTVRVPDEITSTDDLTWILRFDAPLAGGVVGIRWSVAAPDAHPIEGSFSFTVSALPPSTPSTTTSPTATPPTTVDQAATTQTTTDPTTAAQDDPALSDIEPAASQPDSPGEADDTTADDTEADDTAVGNQVAVDQAGSENAETIKLDDFLDTSKTGAAGASLLANTSRVVGLIGAIGAIGGTIFASFVLRGDPQDIRAVLFWVRRAGVVIVIGALAQAAAQLATIDQSWSGLWSTSTLGDVLWSSFGLAVALRLIGGAALSLGARLHTYTAIPATDPLATIKQLTTTGANRTTPQATQALATQQNATSLTHKGDHAWQVSTSAAAFAGVGLIALSFVFDGHTVSEGPRWIHAIANVIHVMTAATWAGGVVMLALIMTRRQRRGADTRALQLGIRFSVVAIIALVAAAVAGTVLSVLILDSISELWTTPWGRLLILKVLLVGVAAAGGAYNHRVIIPELERKPDSALFSTQFKTIVTIEAVALVAVTITTALLIGASSA